MPNNEDFTTLDTVELNESDTELDASDNDLRKLIKDSEETYFACASTGNLSAASASLGVRLRALAELNERQRSREKRSELLDGADPTNPATWPLDLSTFVIKYQDGILCRLSEVNQ